MALNLELKARLPSLEGGEACAARCGAQYWELLRQEDTYFVVEQGRLKLREFGDGRAELIYYERPDTLHERWSRYERGAIHNPEALKRILMLSLGVLAVVRKERRLFLLRGARIHLDTVEGLGTFVEFEVPGHEEGNARSLLGELRRAFQISDADLLKESYADMVLTKKIWPEP